MTRTPDVRERNRRLYRRRLVPPVQNVRLCHRRLILRSLDVARAGQLSLLLGPPGYGKTTLLAQWHERLRDADRAVAWYSAATEDREPGRFLGMLALSLEAAGINPGDEALRAIDDAAPDALFDALVLGLERLDTPVVLIIDDFDQIDTPQINAVLGELLAALPPAVHLALATRRKPMLPYSLLQAQGKVRVIEPIELRLTDEEIDEVLGSALPAGEPAQIRELTEGWPVAVQLYRLWRERASGRGPLPRFGGQTSEMANYFAEQIFADLPDDVQSLLSDLSILGIIEPALADRIREADDSALLLDGLEQALPELVQRTPSDDETVYRLHPLLSDYAAARLALQPGRAARLHQRAAAWLWRQQRYAAAFRHAALSRDEAVLATWADALDFLQILIDHGVAELRAIHREIPLALIAEQPRLQLLRALLLFKDGRYVEATDGLRVTVADAAAAPLSPDARARFEHEAATLDALFATHIAGGAAAYDALARLERQGDSGPLLRGIVGNLRLTLYQQEGRLEDAARSLADASHAYGAVESARNANLYLDIHRLLIELAGGRYREAHERIVRIEREPPSDALGERCLHAMAGIAGALIDYHRHYRPRAAEAMRIALSQFGREEAWYAQHAVALPVLADAACRRQGVEAARAELAEAAAEYRRQGQDNLARLSHALCVLLALRGGDVATADRLAADAPAVADPADPLTPWSEREVQWEIQALRALAQGHADQALTHADALLADAVSGARLVGRIRGHIVRARVLAAGEEGATAVLDELFLAVRLAHPESIVAPFVEHGAAIGALLPPLAERAHDELERRHIATIQRAIAGERQFASPNALTQREAEILAHLANGASNKLIARRLGLTDNTIKFHLKKIFAKLGVTNRRAAVARAAAEG